MCCVSWRLSASSYMSLKVYVSLAGSLSSQINTFKGLVGKDNTKISCSRSLKESLPSAKL